MVVGMTSFVYLAFSMFAMCHGDEELNSSIRKFSAELLNYTAGNVEDVVISPFSVWNLLAGIAVGAYGNSEEQISNALALPTNRTVLFNGYKELIAAMFDSNLGRRELLNCIFLFINENFRVNPKYEKMLEENFGAVIATINFNDTAKAAALANSIVETNIPPMLNLMRPEDFSESLMIMSNGIYFNGYWRTRFPVLETVDEIHKDEKTNRQRIVRRMQLKAVVPFAHFPELNGTVMELPFGNDGKWCMLFVTPDLDANITHLYNKIKLFTLKAVVDKLDVIVEKDGMTELNIKLPRFRLKSEVILNKPLKDMGLYDVFEAGLGGLVGIAREDIYISSFEHMADIALGELGVTAYSTTPGHDQYKVFRGGLKAKDPFIFFIMHKPTRTMVFGGFYIYERYN